VKSLKKDGQGGNRQQAGGKGGGVGWGTGVGLAFLAWGGSRSEHLGQGATCFNLGHPIGLKMGNGKVCNVQKLGGQRESNFNFNFKYCNFKSERKRANVQPHQ